MRLFTINWVLDMTFVLEFISLFGFVAAQKGLRIRGIKLTFMVSVCTCLQYPKPKPNTFHRYLTLQGSKSPKITDKNFGAP